MLDWVTRCPLCGKYASLGDEFVTQTRWKRTKVRVFFHRACYEKITRGAVYGVSKQSDCNNN